jgi:BatD DUF11 like domain
MTIRKILLPVCLLIISGPQLTAQGKFSTIVSEKEVSKDDYVEVEYVVENAKKVEQIAAPAFNGFSIVSGPSQQNGMSIIKGVMSKYEGISFVLKPNKPGKIIIPGATAIVDGKHLLSNSVTIMVTNAPSSQPNPASINPFFGLSLPEETQEVSEEYILRKGESAADKIKNNLLVKLDVSKTSCYAGEPIVATYKLCSRLKSESKVTKRPSLSQFSVYDMIQPDVNNPKIEKINGKPFNVHIIRKVQLYPLQDGSFELDPVELDNTVRFIRADGNSNKNSVQQLLDEYMDGLTQGKLEEQRIVLSSKPVTIIVKPLPVAGRPASFDGAVGRFSISATLTQPVIATNETAVLNVALRGEGNLPLINAPQVSWPQGTTGEEPSVKEDIDKTISPITGTKLFQYSFIVKQAGKIIIPAVEFSYFDPKENIYKIIKSNPVTANIIQSTKKASATTAPGGTDTKTAGNNTYFDLKKLLWLFPVLILFVAGIAVWKRNRNINLAKQHTPLVPEEKTTEPQDPFTVAKMALSATNSQLFYKETGNAIWNILSEKLQITSSHLNKPEVTRLLYQRGVPAETIQQLESVLHDCEMALYTPVHTETDMKLKLEKAEHLASDLNKLI